MAKNSGNDEEKWLQAAAAALLDTKAGRESLRSLTKADQEVLTRAADKVWNPR